MKASKKVMESVIVSGLALTLAVTAVTGNGVNIAAKDAADTQFVNNGIAGVASAMNEYELESADYLDRYISVEKTNAALVAATADGTVFTTSASVSGALRIRRPSIETFATVSQCFFA